MVLQRFLKPLGLGLFWGLLFGLALGLHCSLGVSAPVNRVLGWQKALTLQALAQPAQSVLRPSEVNAAAAAEAVSSSPPVATFSVPFNPKALIVWVQINHLGPQPFVLDTGATYMAISPEIAQALALDDASKESPLSITTASGQVQVPRVRLARVRLAGDVGGMVEARNVEATIMRLGAQTVGGKRFVGLLGLSFLNHFKLTLEGATGRLQLQPL